MIDLKKIIIRWVFPSIPVIQLLLSAYSSLFDYNSKEFGYEVGYSVITSVFYLINFIWISKYTYCYIPIFCSLGLLIMTLVDWQKEYTNYEQYSTQYDFTITLIVTFLIAMAWLVKTSKNVP